jgi:MinD superfamily P-loop ATPase
VAVGLAECSRRRVRLLDCDVEEPNCHLFLTPRIDTRESVSTPVPQVDEAICTFCGECGRVCRYHAIVPLRPKPLVFPELCHGCGGCLQVCAVGAIREVPREIGVVESGRSGLIEFVQGRLHVGEAKPVPLIRAVLRHAAANRINIIDCPPGTGCPVVASVRGSDHILLVSEPTPFSFHDLFMTVDTVREMGIPFGVVLNKADITDSGRVDDLRKRRIPVLMQIPDVRRIAEAYSRGVTAVQGLPELRASFQFLWTAIEQTVAGCSFRESRAAGVFAE